VAVPIERAVLPTPPGPDQSGRSAEERLDQLESALRALTGSLEGYGFINAEFAESEVVTLEQALGGGYGYIGLNSAGDVKRVIVGDYLTGGEDEPAGVAGLFMTPTYLGYYDGTTPYNVNGWKVRIKDDSSFRFYGNAANYVEWTGTAFAVKSEDCYFGSTNNNLQFGDTTNALQMKHPSLSYYAYLSSSALTFSSSLAGGGNVYSTIGADGTQYSYASLSANHSGVAWYNVGCYSATTSDTSYLQFIRSHNGTIGSFSATQTGENLGFIIARGCNSGNALQAAYSSGILFVQEGSAGAAAVPGKVTVHVQDATANYVSFNFHNSGNLEVPGALLAVAGGVALPELTAHPAHSRLWYDTSANKLVYTDSGGTDHTW
jgi:hypothetical protein